MNNSEELFDTEPKKENLFAAPAGADTARMLNPDGYTSDTTVDFDTLAPKNGGSIFDGIEVQATQSPIGEVEGKRVVEHEVILELPTDLSAPVPAQVEGGVIGGPIIDHTIELPGSDAWNVEETDSVATSPLGDSNHN